MGLMVEVKDKNTLEGESIVCFAGEDWWYHHPHSKNHLLKRYALRNKVLFVNSISMGLPSMANPDFFLKIKRKLRSYTRWLRKVPEGLWVMTPVNLPLYGSRVGRWLNRNPAGRATALGHAAAAHLAADPMGGDPYGGGDGRPSGREAAALPGIGQVRCQRRQRIISAGYSQITTVS